MNKLYEQERFDFVLQRDGNAAAVKFARQCIKVYLAALKHKRSKYGRNLAYRAQLIEGAYSFRFILRNLPVVSQ